MIPRVHRGSRTFGGRLRYLSRNGRGENPTELALEIPAELLAHVSPLGWEHINLTGEYRWPGTDRRATRNA